MKRDGRFIANPALDESTARHQTDEIPEPIAGVLLVKHIHDGIGGNVPDDRHILKFSRARVNRNIGNYVYLTQRDSLRRDTTNYHRRSRVDGIARFRGRAIT